MEERKFVQSCRRRFRRKLHRVNGREPCIHSYGESFAIPSPAALQGVGSKLHPDTFSAPASAGLASARTKARKPAASTHISGWVHPSGQGQNLLLRASFPSSLLLLGLFDANTPKQPQPFAAETFLRPLYSAAYSMEPTAAANCDQFIYA